MKNAIDNPTAAPVAPYYPEPGPMHAHPSMGIWNHRTGVWDVPRPEWLPPLGHEAAK